MKRIIFICIVLTSIIFSCDPAESLEAKIRNNTSQDLRINFVSIEIPEFNENLTIISNNEVTFSELGGIGDANLAFHDYDSIYIQNSSDEILKVYKEGSNGKNIYNVDKYWSVNETSKNHFVYTYEIKEEDLE